MAKREKKPVHRVVMTEGKRNIIRQLLEEYDIESAQDIQNALKDLLGGTIKEMMETEMDDHLGYEKSGNSQVIIFSGINQVLTSIYAGGSKSFPFFFCSFSLETNREKIASFLLQ